MSQNGKRRCEQIYRPKREIDKISEKLFRKADEKTSLPKGAYPYSHITK